MSPNEYWSANRRYLLRVDWQTREYKKPLPPLRLTLKEKTQNGLRHLWTVWSPQKLSLTDVYITVDARSVVLCNAMLLENDDKVMVLFGLGGQVRRTYNLGNVLSPDEISMAVETTSETTHIPSHLIWAGLFVFRPRQSQFGFFTQHSGILRLFDLYTGAKIALSPSLIDEVKTEQISFFRARLLHAPSDERCAIAFKLSAIGDKRTVPLLLSLLNDPMVRSEFNSVQTAAGYALVKLLGKEAVPYLQKKLVGANPMMKARWSRLIRQALQHDEL